MSRVELIIRLRSRHGTCIQPCSVVLDRCQRGTLAPPFLLTENGVLIADANIPCSTVLGSRLISLDLR
jgi:hypothetical protein